MNDESLNTEKGYYPDFHETIWREQTCVFQAVWRGEKRKREIKGWHREKKTALIRSVNPVFRDLSLDFHR